MAQEPLFPLSPDVGFIVGGKYRLLRKLSEGGGGVVWAAEDPSHAEVALKFLKWSPLSSRTTLAERFKNEFSILKSLAHPNIAQIYDFGFDAPLGLYYFTSELLQEGDLRSFIGAPVPLLEDLLLQSLRALEYLRGHKLLHLDIKPQNLLIRREGEKPVLALIDFGLATFQPPDRPGGTPNYMAPELIVRRLNDGKAFSYPLPDHRSDLYSLGVTFYHCLTGQQPFNVLSAATGTFDRVATWMRHLTHTPPPPSALRPEIPAYLDRIVLKLMARHPDDRYPSATVAAQALQYSSPREHAPECLQTLLSYLPKKGRLIGRRKEWAIIEETIKGIAAGTPRIAPVICIGGGRGTGRTRLLLAAKPLAQQYEMEVTVFGDKEPLSAAALDEILAARGSQRAQTHAILIDDLDRQVLGAGVRGNDGATFHAFMAFIRRLRLQHRLPDAPKPRIFLLATLCTEQTPLDRALLDLNIDASLCHAIELGNFKASDVADYLAALLGEAPDPTVVDQLMACTQGNPRFLTEHLEQMISQGRLFSLAGRPDAATLKAIGVDFARQPPPRSLSETILARLHLLSTSAQRLALALACWDRPASFEELAATSSQPSVSEDLLALMDAQLLQRAEADGRIAFAVALSARIIRDAAPEEERAAMHDAIARHLAQRRGKGNGELDLHRAYGTAAPERFPALQRVAEQALERGAALEAAEHLEALLAILPPGDVRRRADALVMLGKAYERAHRDREARSAYARIRRLPAPREFRSELHALSAERIGLAAMRQRRLREARECFGEALRAIGKVRRLTAWRLRIENDLASVALREGRVEEATDRFERSAAVALRLLSESERQTIRNNELGEALLQGGIVPRAMEILSQELHECERAGDAERTANRHYLLGNALRHDAVRRYQEARDRYMDGLRLAREHRMVELQVRLQNGLGNLSLKLGKPRDAMAHYEEGLKLAQQIEGETTSVEIMIGMGLAAQQLAAPDRTIEYFEAALDFSRTPKGASAGLLRRYRPTIYVFLGDAYFQKRDFERAEGYLRKALAIDHRQHLTPDIRYSLYGTYMEIFLERGERAAARRYLPTIAAIAKAFPTAERHYAALLKRLEGSD
jgi:tetratricopeptide (TPR) repeat protein